MKKTMLPVLLVLSLGMHAQTYQPTWESLDKRPVPQWFTDAKFGIFIHWGVYAVPAYTTKGSYAEWYQNGLERGDSAKKAYHAAKFGNQTYYQLADQFRAELFQPGEWARVFEQSGAKYIVLTSKHHDGFSLWPSKDANRTWGFPWNAMDAGPRRDLLGDLFKAVRKTSVRAGMYYSLYEWFNPLWKTDHRRYASEHMWPQMKELITNYQPDVFWTDGDWDESEETWRSKEFLAWMYNESPVKDKVVTYDRWGRGLRFKHGGVFTPEYQPDLDFENHAWEESRGMGYSYGYNREEDAWDYNSTQSLIYHLLDKVSRGGNFLLDIGPDEHGKIPPIMQERLLQMGEWLKQNGEAIYHTRRWKQVCQWSEGRRNYKAKKGEDIMMKLTVNPSAGFATKEVFYTYNPKTNSLYAIFPQYPSSRKLVLKNLDATNTLTDIRFLSTNEKLSGHVEGKNLVISLPEYDPNKITTPYAYVVKLSNYGAFIPKPKIEMVYAGDTPAATVTITDDSPGAALMYTVNNGEPRAYLSPVLIRKDAVIKAFARKKDGYLPGDTATIKITGLTLYPAIKANNPKPGLYFKYYESDPMDMSVLANYPALKKGVTDRIGTMEKQRADRYGLVFEGYIHVDTTAGYTFFTTSDDGSILDIDGRELVNNDGNHGFEEREGRVYLEKGYHTVRLRYFDSGGDNNLLFSYRQNGQAKTEVPASMLFH